MTDRFDHLSRSESGLHYVREKKGGVARVLTDSELQDFNDPPPCPECARPRSPHPERFSPDCRWRRRVPADKSLLRLVATGWNPNAFVDLVHTVHGTPSDPRHALAVSLQRMEWQVLFDQCQRVLVGTKRFFRSRRPQGFVAGGDEVGDRLGEVGRRACLVEVMGEIGRPPFQICAMFRLDRFRDLQVKALPSRQ